MRTLVLGIGNTLLSDEGIGVHVIRYLSNYHRNLPNTEIVDGGTLSFTLAGKIESADQLIVIDAAQLNEPAGSVRVFIDNHMDAFLSGSGKRSVHEVGLIDLLSISRLTGGLPQKRALVGIQPRLVDWGEDPSEQARSAIPTAGELVRSLIYHWHARSNPHELAN